MQGKAEDILKGKLRIISKLCLLHSARLIWKQTCPCCAVLFPIPASLEKDAFWSAKPPMGH